MGGFDMPRRRWTLRGSCLLACALVLGASPAVRAWTTDADFDSGAIDTLAQGLSGFDEAGTQTLFSSTRSAAGGQSARMVWPSGSDGWAVAHGYLAYPSTVGDGSEVWARAYFYFESPWSWDCSPVVKVLRGVHVTTSSGDNVGYLSVLADSNGDILLSNEVGDRQVSTGVRFDTDRWQSIEMYAKLSATTPIFRIWKDGVLIDQDTSTRTLASSSDRADFAYVMTYWNGGAPQTQTEYVDEIILTTTTPAGRDSSGNPMIGPLGSLPDPTVPRAPTELRLQSP